MDIESELLPDTQAALDLLKADGRTPFDCVFDGSPAIILRQMLTGCVALPNVQVQPLCPQHDILRTPLSDDVAVVDLSEERAWTIHHKTWPLFYISAAGILNRYVDPVES